MNGATAQCMSALEKANEVRLGRSAVKKAIRSGALSVRDAMADPHVASMRLSDLLMAQRGFGEARAIRFYRDLERAGTVIGRLRTVEDLTTVQRKAVEVRLAASGATS